MAKRKEIFNPRKYMEMAIAVMNKSKNEPRPDGKIPPKVGAVLVFPDGATFEAHRGELREGDHAEFTLLERKLFNKSLEDCVLFTTLEPCVERNLPKISCCRRATNARIKKVYVGIEDPDPTVSGKGIRHLEKHNTKVFMFDNDLQKIIEKENKKFLKQAIERKHQKEKEELKLPLEFTVPNYDSSRFSNKALQKFIREAKLDYKIGDKAFYEYLTDFGAMELDSSTNKFIPTGFGILLFGINPRAKYPDAVLKAHISYNSENIEPKDFDQPLVLIPDLIEEWLRKVLPSSKNTDSFKRKDIPNFPINVLREAIVNALVHRDYEVKGAKCSIEINNNTITVKSPGEPLPAITLNDLNSFNASSLSRNPILTYVFSLMKYVEEKGFGMNTFKSLKKQYNLPIPKFSYKTPYLSLVFARKVESLKYVLDRVDELKESELGAFEIFRLKQPLSKNEFANRARLKPRSAERLLKKFVDLNLVIKQGSGPSTKYILNDK